MFVFDRYGRYLVHGALPEKDGTSLSEIEGLDAEQLVSDAWAICDAEQGGWVNYTITNPTTMHVQAKASYVMPLDDKLLVGCGCYLNEQWLNL